jgi:hypothetical protein
VKNEKFTLVTDCHSVLFRWRNHFPQLFNLDEFSDVRQAQIHTEKSLVPEPSVFKVEKAIENTKRHKAPGIDQSPVELIQAGGRTIRSEIHKYIYSLWNKEYLPAEWRESITVPVYKKGDKTDCSNYKCIPFLSKYVQNFIQHTADKANSICRGR